MFVHSLDKLFHSIHTDFGICAIESTKGATLDEHCVITVIVIACEKLSHLHLDELMHLFIVNDVALVEEDDDGFDADLTAEKDMLASLWHGTVCSRDDEDATVHSRGSCDHVLHVICVTWAIDMTVMAILCFVFNRGGINGNTSCLLLWRLVDISIVLERRCILLRQVLCNGSCKRRFTMINMT